jgi:hypothetical protein
MIARLLSVRKGTTQSHKRTQVEQMGKRHMNRRPPTLAKGEHEDLISQIAAANDAARPWRTRDIISHTSDRDSQTMDANSIGQMSARELGVKSCR